LPNSSIYWHFESKAAILAAVMERGAGRFFAAARVDTDAAPAGDPEHRLRQALHRATDSLDDQAEFLRLFILLALSNQDPDIADVVQRVRRQGKLQLHGLLEFAFAGAGESEAARVADSLVDFAIAIFDGIFIAAQFDPNVMHRDGVEQMASALAHLGEALLSQA
jgi:AcrR family transcriptional regulator